MLKGKKIAFFVTGGIAVYKAVDLMRELIKKGAEVKVAMTPSAAQFVSPLTFQVLSKHKVHIDTFDEETPEVVNHIHLADWADASMVAPLTANTLAKLAHGLADNFVTSALLATTSPIFTVPAMNGNMYDNEATQLNSQLLRGRGIYVMEPDTGFLAEGYSGKGRFPEKERIVEEFEYFLRKQNTTLPLTGKKVLVTAGGTKERIDPVRYLTNNSSGKMGHAVAEAAWQLGADVTLVTASSLSTRSQIKRVSVESALEMHSAVDRYFNETDVLVMSAAVSDYTPESTSDQKMKKQDQLTLSLKKNPDILKEMGSKKRANQYLVGFAAETEKLEEYAQQKLLNKQADMIVANDVGKKDRGFDSDDNEVIFFTHDHEPKVIQLKKKESIAMDIMHWVADHLEGN
ncbi:bifunctional phosphopantothenoylcysteine decarboxylase/phosphopantothenate--cysteine ligase CoaBC [Alkalibacterium sp. MB6]|uniref:bifunctional phosphopantothenoylcysteine decarboxylase/phosphopantothenate--cysteine ligase CoaBC n=1 Tax=Alkalibacterium sp. MB6 TaxID=2081965 RepID=UPI001379D781|nr:bifunctional phosphopantothenoylcysteine decarboxylase/phosphopantothenate--cysteine ligase CoaBC [Alkalibacterium sp. MB6]